MRLLYRRNDLFLIKFMLDRWKFFLGRKSIFSCFTKSIFYFDKFFLFSLKVIYFFLLSFNLNSHFFLFLSFTILKCLLYFCFCQELRNIFNNGDSKTSIIFLKHLKCMVMIIIKTKRIFTSKSQNRFFYLEINSSCFIQLFFKFKFT